MRMPGWYDIKSLSDLQSREEDEAGIHRSRDYFHKLIDDEVAKGIPAMSLFSGVTYKNQLGGIFGLSCYLLLQKTLKDLIPTDSPNQNTPIFMGHGDADQVVAHKYGKLSADELAKLGYKIDFRTYKYSSTTPIAARTNELDRGLVHSADPDEIDHLEAYLNQQIPALGDDKTSL
jgi:predicted esterase